MNKKLTKTAGILLCFLIVLAFTGCNSTEMLLDDEINADDIDKVQFKQAMGNPAYGANSKIITDRSEIEMFVAAFNGAVLGDEVDWMQIADGFPARIFFFSGNEIIYQFAFNVNNTEMIRHNGEWRHVQYPDSTPWEIYWASSAAIIVVDENLEEMERPLHPDRNRRR